MGNGPATHVSLLQVEVKVFGCRATMNSSRVLYQNGVSGYIKIGLFATCFPLTLLDEPKVKKALTSFIVVWLVASNHH